MSVSDIQIDNQLYSKESYDFPVVLIGQEKRKESKLLSFNISIDTLLENTDENALIVLEFVLHTWRSRKDSPNVTGKDYFCVTLQCYITTYIFFPGVKSVSVYVNPISCYVEDTYITKIMEYFKILIPNKLVLWPTRKNRTKIHMPPGSVSTDCDTFVLVYIYVIFRFAYQN